MTAARRHLFDDVVSEYDRLRPTYPDAIYDLVLARIGGPGRVLEVGCGTGKASAALLERGCTVLAVEPGLRLGAFAQALLPAGFQVVQADFEEFETEERFDAIWAAQSWHWVPPDRGYAHARSLLRPDGHLVLVWNWPTGISVDLQAAYVRQYGEEAGSPPGPIDGTIEKQRAEVDASGQFEPCEVFRVPWIRDHSAADYVALMNTWSPILDLGDAKEPFLADIRSLIEQAGGTIRRHLECVAFVAAPVAPGE